MENRKTGKGKSSYRELLLVDRGGSICSRPKKSAAYRRAVNRPRGRSEKLSPHEADDRPVTVERPYCSGKVSEEGDAGGKRGVGKTESREKTDLRRRGNHLAAAPAATLPVGEKNRIGQHRPWTGRKNGSKKNRTSSRAEAKHSTLYRAAAGKYREETTRTGKVSLSGSVSR